MRSFVLFIVLLAAARVAHATVPTMDCVFNDGMEGELTGAPAAWRAPTAAQNCARKTVVPAPATAIPLLHWNTSLASVAQTYANRCVYAHNPATPGGENIAASAGVPAGTALDAALDWIGEGAQYNYAANTCSGTCGHYTQVVWRSSTQIGCGAAHCTTGSPFGATFPTWDFFVCDYTPAGNNGARPY